MWGPEQPRSGQKNKEKKETLKEVLTPFAHRPFQSITHPSLTLRELPIPSGALSYLLKVGLRGAPIKGGVTMKPLCPIRSKNLTGYITDSVGLHHGSNPMARNQGSFKPNVFDSKSLRRLLYSIKPISISEITLFALRSGRDRATWSALSNFKTELPHVALASYRSHL